jgi:hypothetical protein
LSERQRELRDYEGFNGTIGLSHDWSSSVEIDLSREDVDLLYSLYHFDPESPDAYLTLMTVVVIPGSEKMGPSTPLEQNPTKSVWRLRLPSNEKVRECADSKIMLYDLTVANEVRYLEDVTYQVLPAG